MSGTGATSGGVMIELFVNYTMGTKHFQVGPYRSREEALIALTNIRRQPGVSNTWLGRGRFYYRKQVKAA
jgi:hypothetical protein